MTFHRKSLTLHPETRTITHKTYKIMEKNITLSANTTLAATVLNVINTVKVPFFMLRDYYSGIIGKKLSCGQTWQLIEVQVAFFLTVFPAECNFLVRVLLLLWFINSILRLRNSL